MLRDPAKDVMEKAYARWAPVYDVLCGPVFLNGRRAAASAARAVGGRILEIGVGTGLSFDDYDDTTEITGIDMSEPMIARARERAKTGRYPFVKELAVMDAHDLAIRTRRSIVWWPSSSSPWSRILNAFCRNARGCCGGAVRSFWSITFIRNTGLRPRSSACWHRRHTSWDCGLNSPSSVWRHGLRNMAVPSWWNAASLSRSGFTRWCAFNARTYAMPRPDRGK